MILLSRKKIHKNGAKPNLLAFLLLQSAKNRIFVQQHFNSGLCMAQQIPPLYGRFPFTSITEFLQRIQQVSATYMGAAEFSAYVTTHQQESFYGLDYEELAEIFTRHEGEVKSIASSCSGEGGRSVNANVRFPKPDSPGECQFVIVTLSRFESKQISLMLQGDWVERPEEEREKAEEIGKLLGYLLQQKELEEAESRRKQALKMAENAQAAKAAQARQKLRITTIRDKFHFDDQIPADQLVRLLEELSRTYLDNAPFNIRLITSDGQPYSNIGLKGLMRFFEKRRSLVLKLFMDAATANGELIDIMLAFGPTARHLNAEVEITTRQTKAIQGLIRKNLEENRSFIESGNTASSTVHEMFRFEQELFSLDRVIKIVNAISVKYLGKGPPTAFVSTLKGETYPSLDLRQVRTVYQKTGGEVSFMLFGVNHSLSGRTFSLMFQFQAPGHAPYGSLSMRWGQEETHRLIRAVIWEQLQLKAYQPKQAGAAVEGESSPPPTLQKTMSVTPAFEGRDYEKLTRTSLVIMPLEAYWSETMWVHIQQTLKSVGWDSFRAEALFGQDVLEDTWEKLNVVDLLVADLTYKHPDVFYKVGVAHTLGKSIILISQHARDIPPDFRRFPFIVYDNNVSGLQRLAERLVELVKLSNG
jgi:hypothetical protein